MPPAAAVPPQRRTAQRPRHRGILGAALSAEPLSLPHLKHLAAAKASPLHYLIVVRYIRGSSGQVRRGLHLAITLCHRCRLPC